MDIRNQLARPIIPTLQEPVASTSALPPQPVTSLPGLFRGISNDYPEDMRNRLQVPLRPVESERRPPYCAELSAVNEHFTRATELVTPSAPPLPSLSSRFSRPAEYYVPVAVTAPRTAERPASPHTANGAAAGASPSCNIEMQVFSPGPFSHSVRDSPDTTYNGA